MVEGADAGKDTELLQTCLTLAVVNCMKEKMMDKSCISFPNGIKSAEFINDATICGRMTPTSSPEGRSVGDKPHTLCLCQTEKCNNRLDMINNATEEITDKKTLQPIVEASTAAPAPSNKNKANGNGSSSPHQLIPSRKLIFTILTTIAVSNFIDGKTTS